MAASIVPSEGSVLPEETGHLRLCEHFLGLQYRKCMFPNEKNCPYAHHLKSLRPPKWPESWSHGQIDMWFDGWQFF